MKTSSLAALLLLPLAVLAQPTPLLSIDDPAGDDVGDGSLVYPRDSGYEPGDLDLRSLRVFADGNNLRFEATFANPIRDPATVRGSGMGSEDLSVFARRGFYAFNLDIYLDTDRVAGSGNTVTLPGRRATFDPAHGWEKAIVLTPRPELMARQLADTLQQVATAAPGDVAASIAQSVFFATEVKVRGRTVTFMVPTSFIGAQALAGASLTALVTLSKPSVEAELSLLGNNPRSPLERLTLGAAQPEMGRPMAAMGYTSDQAPATAVVDMLSPAPGQQALQLARGGLLTGLNRDNKLGLSSVFQPAAPATPAVASSPTGGSWFSRALGGVAALFGGATGAATAAPVAGASAAAPANVPSLQSIMAPAAAAGPAGGSAAPTPTPSAAPTPAAAAPAVALPALVPAAKPPAPSAAPSAGPAAATAAPASRPAPAAERKAPRDAAFYEEQELRLRTLERLRKNGLISEAEFQQKRKDVLDML